MRTASGELDRKLKSQVSFFRDTLRSQDGPGSGQVCLLILIGFLEDERIILMNVLLFFV